MKTTSINQISTHVTLKPGTFKSPTKLALLLTQNDVLIFLTVKRVIMCDKSEDMEVGSFIMNVKKEVESV